MFCPICGAQNPDNAPSCAACARPFSPADLKAAPPPPPPQSTATPLQSAAATAYAPAPAPPPRVYPPIDPALLYPGIPSAAAPKKMHIVGIIAIAAVALLGIIVGVAMPVPDLPNETQAIGYRIGRLVAIFLIPLLIAYPVAGRRKARNPNLFAGLFCGLALFCLLGSAAGSIKVETTDQMLVRLMREAAGLQPVRKSFFKEDKTETQMRNFFKGVIDINKEYQRSLDALDTSQTKKINTPESYADPDSVTEALRQLHAAYDLDALQEQRLSELLEKFKQGVDQLPASEREQMLRGFDKGLAKALPPRQRAVAAEKAWVDALDNVYAYAESYHSSFVLANGHVGVRDDRIREEFNSRIRAMNARRADFLQARAVLEQIQRQTLERIGLTRSQTGLH